MTKDDLALLEMKEPYWFRVEAPYYEMHDKALLMIRVPIIKYTPKGVWVTATSRRFDSAKKLVLRKYQHRGRAYAASTPEQAAEDFRMRKQFQIRRLQSQIQSAQADLDLLSDGRFYEK